MQITGTTPNGHAVVQRYAGADAPVVLRGGDLTVTTGGISLADSEAPMGVPLEYEAKVSGILLADRLVQQNLMLTPTFTLGQFGWTGGAGRVFNIVADATAHSASVGHSGANGSGVAPSAPPTLVGHVDSAFGVSGSYTLTPTTGGGTAIANNDWMILVHSQLESAVSPATPAGWTLIATSTTGTGTGMYRRFIWKRKRQAGDAGVTIAAPSGAASVGTLLWVRNAIDEILATTAVTTPVTITPPDTPATSTLSPASMSVIRPNLALAFFLENHTGTMAAPTAPGVTDGTFQYVQASGTAGPTQTVVTTSNAVAGDVPTPTLAYAGLIVGGSAIQVILQVASDIASRTIASGKAAAIPGGQTFPYLITGRFRYVTAGLLTWQDIKNVGTWQQVKTVKPTWLDVRGPQSSVTPGFAKLFLTIVNPADGTDYIPPVQVLSATEVRANQWLDFSAYINPATTIPTTAEIRLVHGSTLKEFAIDWYFDEFGITPGAQRAAHSTMYWFSGSSAVPANPQNYMFGPGWLDGAGDAAISWVGTAGNSVSQFYAPSAVIGTSTCQLDPPAVVPCEPVFLSDPVNVTLSIWAGLIKLGEPTHPGTRALYRAMNRAPAIAVSQKRSWEDSELTLLTETLVERGRMLTMLSTGRILLLRNPDPSYPETNWYISIPDVVESRVFQDARRPERLWTLPYTRVERPSGLIEATNAKTWQDAKDVGSWLNLRAGRGTWLGVLTGDSA